MFLSPIFLIAAAIGAAIPLALHLMQNQQRDQQPFPTLRFLKMAEQKSSRRTRMENILLWLLRTLIMLAIGIGFAMPVLRSRGPAFLGDAPRDIALVLDASYSMGYQAGRETVWRKSLATAAKLIEGLGENDRFCIFLARDQPEALIAEPMGDREQGLARLKALRSAAGTGSSQLAPALTAAVEALDKNSGSREREIYLLTDGQAVPWEAFGTGGDAPLPESETGAATEDPPASGASPWDPDSVDQRTTVFVVTQGVPAPENVGPDSITLQPTLLRRGTPGKIVASLARTGHAAETTATLFIDDEQLARRHVRFDTPEGSAPVFAIPPLPPGIHSARLETPDDNLPEDNAFHFLIRVQDRLPALCVGAESDTLFVRTAIRTGVGGDITTTVDTAGPGEVTGKTLGDYACVFLCNALPLSGQAVLALENYVEGGGLLVVFPGMRANADAYKPWTCLPGKPGPATERAWSERGATLTWERPDHPLIGPLRKGGAIPALTVRRQLAWDEIHQGARELIAMGADQPFLLERAFGKGRVLMFSVAADRTWSDFPLSPFYLPVVLQCVDYGAGLGSWSPFLWTTDSLSLAESLPGATATSKLRNPRGNPVPIRGTTVDGRTVVVAEELTSPGIYQLDGPAASGRTPALAINLERRESDLTPLSGEAIRARLGIARAVIATDQQSLDALIEEHRLARTYGEHLLWLALALIVVEFSYANSLLKKGPRLSDQLSVDPSGQVRGGVGEGNNTAEAAG